MSIPLICSKCHDFVGSEDSLNRLNSDNFSSEVDVDCPGKGKHAQPTTSRHKRLFGLIDTVTLHYPQTDTQSSWEEYVGPKNRFWLWFAIVFGTEQYPNGSYSGVLVNKQWCWWDRKLGFYGDGYAEFQNLPA